MAICILLCARQSRMTRKRNHKGQKALGEGHVAPPHIYLLRGGIYFDIDNPTAAPYNINSAYSNGQRDFLP